jgi:iron complex outermembrane recepter protein
VRVDTYADQIRTIKMGTPSMRTFKMAAEGRLCVVLLSALCTTLLLGTTLAAQPAQARGVTYNLDIPAQSLNDALQAFALASQHKLLYSSDLVNGKRSPALKGPFTTEQAVKALLVGTNLNYEVTSDGLVLIRAADEPSRSGAAPAATSDDPAGEDSTAKEGKNSSSGEFRLAQVDQGASANSISVTKDSVRVPQKQSDQLEEVVVTAQKRDERLIDTPQSVSVLSAKDIAKLGATQFSDFANTVPGLSFNTGGAGATNVTLRGVTTGADVNVTVGTYVDEVPYGISGAFAQNTYSSLDVGLFDIDRIEVLRGPQGTLYGASTVGGLIKYVTKAPDTTNFGGDVQTGVSSTQSGGVNYNVAAAVNLPIVTDKAAVRLSGYETHDGGYIDNVALGQIDVNRSNIYGGRLDLLLTPTDRLNVRVVGFLQDITRDGDATANYSLDGAQTYGSLGQYRKFAEPWDQQFRLVSATVNYDAGPVKLTSISSYQTVRNNYSLDVSSLYVPVFATCPGPCLPLSAVGYQIHTGTDKVTEELRLASTGEHTLDWLVGGFYTHESTSNNENLEGLTAAGLPSPANLFTFSVPSTYEELAAFGDLTWHVTSKFDATGGVRYSHDSQEKVQIGSGLFGSSQPQTTSDEGVVTYLANARYHFTNQEVGYVRFATGYRPGGPNFVSFNPITHVPNGQPTFESDQLYSYEAGFKAETDDRRFGIDVAGYYIDWRNIQIMVSSGGFTGIANAAGGAKITGAELTLTARPITALTMTGAFAYQDARLKEAVPSLQAAAGERLPNVPRGTVALNADYQVPFWNVNPTVGATFRYVGDRYSSFDASTGYPQYRLPEYTALDLRTGVTINSVGLQLYVHNVTDQRGQLGVLFGQFGNRVAIMEPRTVGISADVHF